jgi:hypothetical protein
MSLLPPVKRSITVSPQPFRRRDRHWKNWRPQPEPRRRRRHRGVPPDHVGGGKQEPISDIAARLDRRVRPCTAAKSPDTFDPSPGGLIRQTVRSGGSADSAGRGAMQRHRRRSAWGTRCACWVGHLRRRCRCGVSWLQAPDRPRLPSAASGLPISGATTSNGFCSMATRGLMGVAPAYRYRKARRAVP